jgi:hypothetical protein
MVASLTGQIAQQVAQELKESFIKLVPQIAINFTSVN